MFEYQDWGIINYHTAWDRQKELVRLVQEKREKSYLIFCEHPSVITIGRNGSEKNIKATENFLNMLGIDTVLINRGGDVTLHNPGQLVGYPIFNLSSYKEDLHWFLREIEQCIIDLLATYSIDSCRVEGLTGVWLAGERKICAMGMHCSRWVTSHGFALNVANNLEEFNYIVPCGISDKQVTSITDELGMNIDIGKVKADLLKVFENKFN